MCAFAEIDIGALRRARAKPAMGNMLARQRLDLFRKVYGGDAIYPANTLVGNDTGPDREFHIKNLREAILRLRERGCL